MAQNKSITIFSGVVLKDNQVLMTLRDEEECPDAHMKWEFPGGKCDFGETPEQSVEREIFEETGVTAKVRQLLPYVQTCYWDYDWGKQQTFCFVFVCDFIKQEEPKERDHHIAKIEWKDLKDIPNLPSLPGTNEVLPYLNDVRN